MAGIPRRIVFLSNFTPTSCVIYKQLHMFIRIMAEILINLILITQNINSAILFCKQFYLDVSNFILSLDNEFLPNLTFS